MSVSSSNKLFALASDAERATGLAGFLAALSGSGAAAEPVQAAAAKVAGVSSFAPFLSAALDMQDVVLAKASEEEAEGFYIILTSFFSGGGAAAASLASDVARRVCGACTAGGAAAPRAGLRLRILAQVFNAVEARDARLALLMATIAFASETKQLDALAPYLASLAAGAAQRAWALTDDEARDLFLLLARAYGDAGDGAAAQAFLIRYLATFEGPAATPAALAAAAPHARAAALGYIRAPALSQRSSLAHLAAVRALAADPAHAKLHELLTIFSCRGLDDYSAFAAANGDFLASIGVAHEASLRTMRLLTLCSLASGKTSLSYDAIATALAVPVTEVEAWVVSTISEGLIDARMDQLTSSVVVTRAMQREFGSAQWLALQAKLAAWKTSVAGLLAVVEQRTGGGGGGGGGGDHGGR